MIPTQRSDSSILFRAWRALAVAGLLALLGAQAKPARGEVVEEIVAWVNGEIITKSELDQEEKMMLSEVYKRFSGPALDAQVKEVKGEILDRIIERKLLIQKASRLYDVQKMGAGLLEDFKEQQKIKTDDELRKALAQEGMTIEELKQRLIEMYAPEQIIRFEVIGRLAVSDQEIQEYYDTHPQLSEKPGKATVREIVLLAEGENKESRRAEAQQLRERVAAPGADFGAIASESSESATKSSGGLLGSVVQGDLAPELEAFVFHGQVGEVSPVIEMPHGFHILKVDERTDARKTPEAELKEDLRKAVEQDKYASALAAYLQKARAESEVIVNDRYKDRASTTQTR